MSCPRRAKHWFPIVFLWGLCALVWLLIRSGGKPSRLSYPCQQAALGSVSLLFTIPLTINLGQVFERIRVRRPQVVALCLVAATAGFVGFTGANRGSMPAINMAPLPDYTADVFMVEDAGGPMGDHHLGLDDLITCMSTDGLYFYRSSTSGHPDADPDGIVGASDVVLIKINQQWPERGGTNTDVLRGLIARIIEHPDGFSGEVVVVENTQARGMFDWAEANAENHSQSAQDVVDHFFGMGWAVSTYLLDTIRTTEVSEYADGDLRDGYVVEPWNAQAQTAVSYPKFQTPESKYVSLKHGLWHVPTQQYDDSQFTFLNVPVLKCHGAVYGVTAASKNHVGTMTTSLSTNTHSGVRYGGLGAFLGSVRQVDLNILDCIYILARPNAGPWCTYEEATRVDKLCASVDPIALDLWATINILVPTILDNGYSSYPMQDPWDPGSQFRTYLDRATDLLLMAGVEVTNDPEQIEAHVCQAVATEPTDGEVVAPRLIGARPNPFRSETAIRFDLGEPAELEVAVFDGAGRLVRRLTVSALAGAGQAVVWDGRDAMGRSVAAGVYHYRITGAGKTMVGKATRLPG